MSNKIQPLLGMWNRQDYESVFVQTAQIYNRTHDPLISCDCIAIMNRLEKVLGKQRFRPDERITIVEKTRDFVITIHKAK